MIVAITGHRPPKVGGYNVPNSMYDAIRLGLREELRRLSPDCVLSGMALGVDQWAAEVCIAEGIPFDAIIPFRGYESRWPDSSKERYRSLLRQASHTHYVTDTDVYRASHMFRRNAWMVDHADILVAVWNGTTGGTAHAVEYARNRRKEVRLLDIDWAAAILPTPTSSPSPRWERRRSAFLDSPVVRASFRLDSQPEPVASVSGDDIAGEVVGVADQVGMRDQELLSNIVSERIRERVWGFVGQPNTPQTLEAIRQETMRVLNEIRGMGPLPSGTRVDPRINVEMESGPDAGAFLTPVVNPDSSAGWEEHQRWSSNVERPTEDPPKEIIKPEDRFKPSRIIDIED
jgi:uncharacterized phage-like protein YoqJ